MTLVDVRHNALNYMRDFSAVDYLAAVKKDFSAIQVDDLDVAVRFLLDLSYNSGDPVVDVNTVRLQPALTETQKRMVALVNEVIVGHNATPVSFSGKPVLDLVEEDTAKALKKWVCAVNEPLSDKATGTLIHNMITTKIDPALKKFEPANDHLEGEFEKMITIMRNINALHFRSPLSIDFNGVSVPLGSKVLVKDFSGQDLGEGDLTGPSLSPNHVNIRLTSSFNPAIYPPNQTYPFAKYQVTPITPGTP